MEKTIEFNIPKGYKLNKDSSTNTKLVYEIESKTIESPESFLKEIMNGLKIEIEKYEIYFIKNSNTYFIYNKDKNNVIFDYMNIYCVLRDKFELNEKQIYDLVISELYKNLNLKVNSVESESYFYTGKKVYKQYIPGYPRTYIF